MSKETPEKVRPYTFHGVDLGMPKNNECSGQCPFCDRDGKFSVNTVTGKWKCWVCGEGTEKGGGNVYTFLRKFHAMCLEATKTEEYRTLADDRGYLAVETLVEWGVVKSTTTGNWLIPGYNPQRSMVTLYQWFTEANGSRNLKPTPTLGHHIHGMNFWDQNKPIAYICEGPWDAIALWEILTRVKNGDHGMVQTASRESSLYSQANVIAVPGCNVMFEQWLHLFEGKVVNLLYDSDHQRKHPKTGTIITGAGWSAMEMVTKKFVESTHAPQELNCIRWNGDAGYDPKLKSGYDIRDLLTKV